MSCVELHLLEGVRLAISIVLYIDDDHPAIIAAPNAQHLQGVLALTPPKPPTLCAGPMNLTHIAETTSLCCVLVLSSSSCIPSTTVPLASIHRHPYPLGNL